MTQTQHPQHKPKPQPHPDPTPTYRVAPAPSPSPVPALPPCPAPTPCTPPAPVPRRPPAPPAALPRPFSSTPPHPTPSVVEVVYEGCSRCLILPGVGEAEISLRRHTAGMQGPAGSSWYAIFPARADPALAVRRVRHIWEIPGDPNLPIDPSPPPPCARRTAYAPFTSRARTRPTAALQHGTHMTEYAPNYPLSYPNPPFPYAPHSETPLRSCAVAVPRTPPPAVPGRPPYPVGQQWIGARESPTRPPPPSPPPNTFPLWDTLKYLFDTTSVQNSEVINHMYFDAPDVSEALDIPVSSMFMQKIYARMFPAPPPSPEKPPAAPLDYYAKLEEFQDAIDDSMTATQISDSFRGIFNQDLPASVTQSEVWQSIVSRAGNRRRSEEVVELVRRIQAHPVNAEAPTSESPRAASTLTPKPTHQMDVSEPASHQSINQ